MPITFNCPECRAAISADERFAGREAKCPRCKLPVRIPIPSAPGAPASKPGFEVLGPNIRILGEPAPGDPDFLRDFTAALTKIGESGANLVQIDFSRSAYREGNRLPLVTLAKNILRPYQTQLQICLTGVFTS